MDLNEEDKTNLALAELCPVLESHSSSLSQLSRTYAKKMTGCQILRLHFRLLIGLNNQFEFVMGICHLF